MARYQQHYKALGSEVFITLVLTKENEEQANKLFLNISNKINNFENRFSRFKTDSELTFFNNNAGKKTVVSKQFLDLISTSYKLSQETAGFYNPLILPGLQKAGYKGSWPNPDKDYDGIDYSSRKIDTYEQIKIDKTWVQIPKNTALDFGGIGKGYLLDLLSDYLANKKLAGYWLSIGGDIVCNGYDLESKPWQIGVQSADKVDKVVSSITNMNGNKLGIATSGVTKRKGVSNGQNWHHIIDPRTGKSVETTILTVTVTSKQAVNADVFAKSIIIGGKIFADIYKNSGMIDSYYIQTIKDSVVEGLNI